VSAWDEIDEVFEDRPVFVGITRAQAALVREALAADLYRQLDESPSVWPLLEAAMGTAVKGLSGHEAQLLRGMPGGDKAQVKRGDTGEVMMMDPKSWLGVKQQLAANPDYYKMLGGGVVDVPKLTQKIEQALALVMGKQPAGATASPVQSEPGLGGNPADITPSEQGNDFTSTGTSPFSKRAAGEDAGARKRRVAAQDTEMMGGRANVDRMTRSGKTKVGA
jgi:hypothetical protein